MLQFKTIGKLKKFCFKSISYMVRKNLRKVHCDAYYLCNLNLNYYKTNEKLEIVSPWHDIEHKHSNENRNVYRMVVEITYHNSAKMEMSKSIKYNPIIQDYKYDKLNQKVFRFNKLPIGFNYGLIPQTWENNKIPLLEDMIGDDDPLDIVEVSNQRYYIGQVVDVVILGAFCLIDQGEVDWKILSIDKNYLTNLNQSAEFWKEHNLSTIKEIMKRFKEYKMYEGKKMNNIYKDKLFSQDETHEVIEKCHKDYLANKDYLSNYH